MSGGARDVGTAAALKPTVSSPQYPSQCIVSSVMQQWPVCDEDIFDAEAKCRRVPCLTWSLRSLS